MFMAAAASVVIITAILYVLAGAMKTPEQKEEGKYLAQRRRKRPLKDPHQSRADGTAMFRTCGNNARKMNSEESVCEYPRRKMDCWKAKKEMVSR
jgi:hypothetical protein